MSAKLFTPFRSFSGRASGTRCLLAFRKRTLAALTFADALVLNSCTVQFWTESLGNGRRLSQSISPQHRLSSTFQSISPVHLLGRRVQLGLSVRNTGSTVAS
jgi:hypothetical protein